MGSKSKSGPCRVIRTFPPELPDADTLERQREAKKVAMANRYQRRIDFLKRRKDRLQK